MSITKDIGEYYIYHKDNSNLIAKGYERFLIKKVVIGTTKGIWMGYIYQLGVYTKMVKVDLNVQFKISVMKRKFEIKSIRLRFLQFENNG